VFGIVDLFFVIVSALKKLHAFDSAKAFEARFEDVPNVWKCSHGCVTICPSMVQHVFWPVFSLFLWFFVPLGKLRG
jgi:hypothetical protein